MYNHEPKNYICPFCQIVKGEPTDRGDQERSVVLRGALATAFISAKWWKLNPGHVIIVPNKHYENIYDLDDEAGHAVFDLSKKISIALKEAYKCDGVSLRQHNEPDGNQDVWHYHLHVFPRYAGDNLYANHEETSWRTEEEKEVYAKKLKALLNGN